MKILLLMNPGIPVPPKLYGGIERIVYLLAEEYIRMGHEVTLLAGPDSYCSGTTITFGLNKPKENKTEDLVEVNFVWKFLRKNHSGFDLIHNFGRLIYFLPVLNKPVKKIMTYERPVSQRGIKFTTSLPNKNLVFTGCSNYCVSTGNVKGKWATVYNALDFSLYDLTEGVSNDAPLMFLGRVERIKGVHHAVRVAKATGRKLLIGGNIPEGDDYFKTEIEPFVDGDQIKYLGALNDEQKNTYLGQSAALLFPIEWDEPFGIVMIEAMACGTPVIGFNRGSVPEVVENGLTGFAVSNGEEMAVKVNMLDQLDRRTCRETARKKFNINTVATAYLSLFD